MFFSSQHKKLCTEDGVSFFQDVPHMGDVDDHIESAEKQLADRSQDEISPLREILLVAPFL